MGKAEEAPVEEITSDRQQLEQHEIDHLKDIEDGRYGAVFPLPNEAAKFHQVDVVTLTPDSAEVIEGQRDMIALSEYKTGDRVLRVITKTEVDGNTDYVTFYPDSLAYQLFGKFPTLTARSRP